MGIPTDWLFCVYNCRDDHWSSANTMFIDSLTDEKKRPFNLYELFAFYTDNAVVFKVEKQHKTCLVPEFGLDHVIKIGLYEVET